MTLQNKLSEFVRESNIKETSISLAKKFIDLISPQELIGILAEEIDNLRRDEVRAKEKNAFAEAFFSRHDKKIPDMVRYEGFVELLKEKFSLGDGNTTRWGEATIEEHQARVAFLEKMRDGLDETISYHKKAIELLKAKKARCLNEVLVCV